MSPEKRPLVICDDGKAVFGILKKSWKIKLIDLKGQSGLSNKKWDKTIRINKKQSY